MEVELDLWSSRSSDPVDHILSDVDCCDVPDVDEFILGCSSASELAKNDLTSSVVDMHLNHHQLGHHLMDEPVGLVDQHQHMGRLGPQSASPADEECCDELGSHHAGLNSLVEHLNELHQLPNSQHTNSQQHQLHEANQFEQRNLLLVSHARAQNQNQHFHHQPSMLELSQHHQQHQLQLVSQSASSTSSSGCPYPSSTSSPSSASSTSPSSSTNNQRLMLSNDRLINESLVASRVDHCYIFNNPNNCQQLQHQHSQAQQIQQVVNSNIEDPAKNFISPQVNFTGMTSAGGVSSSTNNTMGQPQQQQQQQLQLFLNNQTQPGASFGGSDTASTQASNKPATGNKRRQPTTNTSKRTKTKAGPNNLDAVTHAQPLLTQTLPKGSWQKAKPTNSQTVSSSSKQVKSSKGQTISTTTPNDARSQPEPGKNQPGGRGGKRANKQQQQQQQQQSNIYQIHTAESQSGQVSPVLSSNSSSGVSSLSFSSSASNSSSSDFNECPQLEESVKGALSYKGPDERTLNSPNTSSPLASPKRQRNKQTSQNITSSASASSVPTASTLTSSTQPTNSCSSASKNAKKNCSTKLEHPVTQDEAKTSLSSSSYYDEKNKDSKNLLESKLLDQTKNDKIEADSKTFSLSKLLSQAPSNGKTSTISSSTNQTASKLFGANLSASSRQKLNSLSSCLIVNPTLTSSNGIQQAPKAPNSSSSPTASPEVAPTSLVQSSPVSSSVSSSATLNGPSSSCLSSGSRVAADRSANSSSFSSSSSISSSLSCSSSSPSSASSSPTMQLGSSSLAATSVSSMALISTQDWKSAQSGQIVVLTEEERRTLVAEGYPIPQRFPLSKAEERSLKKIRRKIKNKISAQESRRKKKEYMEELEKKVHQMEVKIADLERENRLFKERAELNQIAQVQSREDISQEPNKLAQTSESSGDYSPAGHFPVDSDSNDQTNNPEQSPRRDLTQNNTSNGNQNNVQQQQQQLTNSDDDYFIDHILMSQERQEEEGQQEFSHGDKIDLVANLVGVVCESDELSIVDMRPDESTD